jgi:hypothetical protein
MLALQEQYLVDREGKQIGALLGVEQFHQILEELEELDAIRAYDDAKGSGDEAVAFEQAVAEIEQTRA